MKPLTEWTTDELREYLSAVGAMQYGELLRRESALAEMLRRERERCAAEIDSHMYCAFGGDTPCSCVACAAAIRALT